MAVLGAFYVSLVGLFQAEVGVVGAYMYRLLACVKLNLKLLCCCVAVLAAGALLWEVQPGQPPRPGANDTATSWDPAYIHSVPSSCDCTFPFGCEGL